MDIFEYLNIFKNLIILFFYYFSNYLFCKQIYFLFLFFDYNFILFLLIFTMFSLILFFFEYKTIYIYFINKNYINMNNMNITDSG